VLLDHVSCAVSWCIYKCTVHITVVNITTLLSLPWIFINIIIIIIINVIYRAQTSQVQQMRQVSCCMITVILEQEHLIIWGQCLCCWHHDLKLFWEFTRFTQWMQNSARWLPTDLSHKPAYRQLGNYIHHC